MTDCMSRADMKTHKLGKIGRDVQAIGLGLDD
jgi:hypothetical protein